MTGIEGWLDDYMRAGRAHATTNNPELAARVAQALANGTHLPGQLHNPVAGATPIASVTDPTGRPHNLLDRVMSRMAGYANGGARGPLVFPTRPPRPPRPGQTGTPTPTTTPTPAPITTREQALAAVNAKFNPGFEVSAVPSTLLDDAINSIMQEQQGSASDYLNRGLARGIFNDVGYNAGEQALNNSAQMGRSDLSSLGSSVIDKYRGLADGVAEKAYNAASGFQPGVNFSIDPYVSEFSDITHRAQQNAGGDLRNILGGKNYFDFSNLSNHAGLAQGATNLRDADVATALAERRRQNLASRGLGSQGAF